MPGSEPEYVQSKNLLFNLSCGYNVSWFSVAVKDNCKRQEEFRELLHLFGMDTIKTVFKITAC